MFEKLGKAIERGKTNLIVLLIGGIVGAGITLWLTREKRARRQLLSPPRTPYQPAQQNQPEVISINLPSGAPGTSGLGDVNLDLEVADEDVDFDLDGEF